MNESKNIILAVALSALVLIGWTWAANRFFPTANPPTTQVEGGKRVSLPQTQAQPVPTAGAALKPRAQVLGATPRVRIRR